jgi:hypothetical protein
MGKEGDVRIAAARKAADHLAAIGQYKMAEDVRMLCRSHAALRNTASTIHRELEDTRRAAGMPTWKRNAADG